MPATPGFLDHLAALRAHFKIKPRMAPGFVAAMILWHNVGELHQVSGIVDVAPFSRR
jgi:hypothetical protein